MAHATVDTAAEVSKLRRVLLKHEANDNAFLRDLNRKARRTGSMVPLIVSLVLP